MRSMLLNWELDSNNLTRKTGKFHGIEARRLMRCLARRFLAL